MTLPSRSSGGSFRLIPDTGSIWIEVEAGNRTTLLSYHM
jgi:hypothetical protein